MDSKKETTRQKIFEVSLRLFAEKGYGSTTIRDISKAAGISTGLLFHYFPNKQALLTEHLELAAGGMAAVMGLLESKQAPLNIFYLVAELTLNSLREPVPRHLYLLMSQPMPDDVVDKALLQKIKKDKIIQASLPLIKKGQTNGEIKPGDPTALASVFFGAIQGTAEVLAGQPATQIPEPDWLVAILRIQKS